MSTTVFEERERLTKLAIQIREYIAKRDAEIEEFFEHRASLRGELEVTSRAIASRRRAISRNRGLVKGYEHRLKLLGQLAPTDEIQTRSGTKQLAIHRALAAKALRDAGLTYKAVGAHFGVTGQRAKQIIWKAEAYLSHPDVA